MAFSSHFLIISALLICLCSSNEYSKMYDHQLSTTTLPEEITQTYTLTSQPSESISTSQPSGTTDTVTSEPAESMTVPEPTGQTITLTSESAEIALPFYGITPGLVVTTSVPEPTNPTDITTAEPAETTTLPDVTAQTDTLTSQPSETISTSQPTGPTDTLTSEPTGTTSVPELTGHTDSITSGLVVTTSVPEPTNPTDITTAEPAETTTLPDVTAQTDTLTSQPAETTMQSGSTGSTDTVTSEPTSTTSASESTGVETISPPQPTGSTGSISSVPASTSSTSVTSEYAKTTSSAEATFTTNSPSTHPTGPTSSPATESTTRTPNITPTDLPTGPSSTLTTIPSTKAPTTVPTTPPATPTEVTTVEPYKCQNGGYFNGFNCTCLGGFTGKFCQFIESFEPVALNRSVAINMVIDQTFNEKYEDKTSTEYKEFVGNFTEQMETYYLGKKIANFKEVVVTSVSRGGPSVRFSDNTVEEMRLSAMIVYSIAPSAEGVRVTHDVILFIPNNASSEQLYMDDFKSIKEAVYELVNCTGDCPYSVISPPKVNTTETDLRSLCERLLDNPDIAEFYEPVSAEGKIICVTACNSQHSHHKKCYNKGICNVFSSTGPYCECQNVNSTWYLNDDCSLPIQRTAFYAGLSVTLVCLLVTVGALTAYVLINKNKQKQKRDIKEKLVNQWLNEDFEWSRSNSLTGTGNKNPSFTHEETATHREEAGDYRGPVPSFYPDNRQSSPSVSMYSASQTAYRHNMPSSSAGYTQSASPALPHGDLSSTQPMTISRPQIRTSFDA